MTEKVENTAIDHELNDEVERLLSVIAEKFDMEPWQINFVEGFDFGCNERCFTFKDEELSHLITLEEARELAKKKELESHFEDAERYMSMHEANKVKMEDILWKEKPKSPQECVDDAVYGLSDVKLMTMSKQRIKMIEDAVIQEVLTEEVCEDFINYLEKHFYPNKRSEKQMGNEEMWSLYEVIIVDKDDMKVKTAGQDYIIAKSAKMALGKAGYFDLMEEKDYDESKLEEKVVKIMDIKPADEDED